MSGHDVKVCRSCKAKIVWARTQKGKAIPLDYPPVKRFLLAYGGQSSPVAYTEETFETHFSTCPDADRHRKKTC